MILDGRPAEIFAQSDKLYEVGLETPETVRFCHQFRALGWNLPEMVLTPEDLMDALPAYQGHDTGRVTKADKPSGKAVIQLEDVHYTYLAGSPLAKTALTGASLAVVEGQIHGIAGTNGSGKSTLLQHINGILRAEKGRVRVKSLAVSDPATPLKDVIRQVGLVFQSPETQFFEIFVGDEIAYGPKQFNLPDLRQRVRDAMAMVGLDFKAYKDRRLDTLSGGEKRKVALASTLILDPDIFLFDEPTAGMDPQARDDLLALFEGLKHQGKTILIASHRLEELARAGEMLALMKDGQVLREGSTCRVLMDADAVSRAGLVPPLSIRLSQALIERGWPINGLNTSTSRRLIAALKELSE